MINSASVNTILIVDDNPSNLEVLSETLSNDGFDVAVATSGERAIKQIKCRLPSLILLDIDMPQMDGFETCQRLKENPIYQTVPVIFITALTDVESKIKGLNLGAVDYITKPFQKEEVLSRIRLHLQLKQLMETLEIKNQQLQQLNDTLEQQVAERTQELSWSLEELKQTQLQLVQHEKMSVLGQMMAGIVHEINGALALITSSIDLLQNRFKETWAVIDTLPTASIQITESFDAQLTDHANLNELREEVSELFEYLKRGARRLTDISRGFRIYSRGDIDRRVLFDVHDIIDSTLILLQHRLKSNAQRLEIKVLKNYQHLPILEGFPGQLSQVLMNIFSNAIDALEEFNQIRSIEEIIANPNTITVQTHIGLSGNYIIISIRDNGIGMSEEVKQKIFDYLFTTKTVGKGTGLGLAIARQIVVEKHGGAIAVNSAPLQGTEFVITLPLQLTTQT
jgi:signal transduction histidine kinase